MVRPPDPRLIATRFTSPLRSPLLTSQLGLVLLVTFGICMITGYLSHAIAHPPWWFTWPARPVNLYRFTQGLHVATGLALIPVLAVKLWSVYPRLFEWPPVRGARHGAERLGVALLVAAALFQVTSGLLNISRWYAPMPFFFTAAHYWTGWLVTGALLLHLAVKLPLVGQALREHRAARVNHPAGSASASGRSSARDDSPAGPLPEPATPARSGLSRRGLLAATAATSGLVTVTTIGQTVRPLASVSVLGPRDPRVGPQGLPVNRTAVAAGVVEAATSPGYRLILDGPDRSAALALADLSALIQHAASLPISCVEGWSADGHWAGVRVRDLAALIDAPTDAPVLVESLQRGGRYRSSILEPPFGDDPLTLLALRLGGAPLALDHGYPCRLIAPNRPGVLQTKWVSRLRFGS